MSSLARLCGELMEHCLLMPVSGGVASPLRVLFRICHTCHTCLSTHCQSRLARLPFCPFCSPQSPVAAACIRSCSSVSISLRPVRVHVLLPALLCSALLRVHILDRFTTAIYACLCFVQPQPRGAHSLPLGHPVEVALSGAPLLMRLRHTHTHTHAPDS